MMIEQGKPPKILDLFDQWKLVFHKKYGPCFNLDTENVDYGKILVGVEKLRIEFQQNVPWKHVVTLFHDKAAFSDDESFLTTHYAHIASPQQYDMQIGKKLINTVSTKRFPCGAILHSTCIDMELKNYIYEK